MTILHIGILIRVLFVVAMISLLVVAGALLARRERRLASIPDRDAPSDPALGPAVAERSPRYSAGRERLESNDSETAVPAAQRLAV